ncbi:hypothetical protein Hesp01_13640 [Herbidospora sp. NBRC 101105]|nr:hypothetical protein Hesp01_13640 [Herbidospora sp. NBRC 101105]
MSWPPNTSSPNPANGSWAKSGSSETRPTGAASPNRTAVAPAIAVVATDPRTPTNQTPVRLCFTITGFPFDIYLRRDG